MCRPGTSPKDEGQGRTRPAAPPQIQATGTKDVSGDRPTDLQLYDLPTTALAVIILGMFTGSLVKGVLGAGIPAVGLPIMVMVIDPAQAVPLFLVPVALSNVWQIWEAGELREALRRYWSFTLVLMICVWIGAGALVSIDPNLIALCVGILVICTTLIQIFSPDVSQVMGRIRGLIWRGLS